MEHMEYSVNTGKSQVRSLLQHDDPPNGLTENVTGSIHTRGRTPVVVVTLDVCCITPEIAFCFRPLPT